MGGIPSFNLGSNPLPSRWRNQPGGQASTQVSSHNLNSLVLILTNMFGMMNPPLSFRVTPGGGQFHTLGNPQPRATLVGGNVYNHHQKFPTGIMTNQPLMHHPRRGSYNPGQGHGAYQNPGWVEVPQTQYIQGAWG
jgi:hypothetical protein